MTPFMQAHPVVIVAVVAVLIAAWLVILWKLPLWEEEVESLDPWPPEPRPIPSNVRLMIGANVFDFDAQEVTPWLADDGL